jgi:4-alpha-glucanotransferase
MASLGDLLLEPEPQNVPGTGSERPNWRRRYPWALEELGRREEIASVLERIDRNRRAGGDGTTPS